MNYSLNHNIKVGEIVSSVGEQIAIADAHEIWEPNQADTRTGTWKTVGEATIRIASDANNIIHTNMMHTRGLVCFLPNEYKGCGILKVRITHIYNKSVEAIPIDYVKHDKPLDWMWHGQGVNELLQQITEYPSITRVQEPIRKKEVGTSLDFDLPNFVEREGCTHPIVEFVKTNGVIDRKCTRCGVVIG